LKLITEQNFQNLEYLSENTSEGKRMYIEGIFIQAEKKNRNGRIYESKILKPVVDRYITEQVNTGRAGGELNHPQSASLNPERISHRTIKMEWKNNDVYGKALVLNTPTGNIVKGLLEGGFKLGVSSRGMGSLQEKNGIQYVQSDYSLVCVDCVSDPSAPDAFVNGILEGIEFVFDSKGKLISKEANTFMERKRKTINESTVLKKLENFLGNL
jgi:hypothetical protein